LARKVVSSIVAKTCPLLTFSPTETSTLVTVPPLAKDRSARCFGSSVPVVLTVLRTVCVATVTVRSATAAELGVIIR